ncbi:hypothetical protein M501DRAFT_998320 [Patellaria atrata CBS 101060]|uniref:Uncharacterized protein n=1 Tax=Patellaria atrata CBS 101060 TaxID=1346257 RepID=A0A9P4VSI7_9PEZI|nr:hypothetical protein M501DRAFT_998320 [Patellaria atrata CBS 101060]
MISIRIYRSIGPISKLGRRCVSTLPNSPHIYHFPHPNPAYGHILTLLPTSPPTQSLAIATSTSIPPTPQSTTENPKFLSILNAILRDNVVHDPVVQASANAFASSAGSSYPATLSQPAQQRKRRGEGAGGASAQGGMGGAGRGGWVHVSDLRNPPDYGRIANPEDIFGSVEVDGRGQFVEEGGNFQESGTYRIVTREGILGLSPYMRETLIQRLKELESREKKTS